MLLAFLPEAFHGVLGVNELRFKLRALLVYGEDLPLELLVLVFEALELREVSLPCPVLLLQVVVLICEELADLGFKALLLLVETVQLECELVLQLGGVLLGLMKELVLIVPGGADFLLFEGEGSLKVCDLLLGLLKLVSEDARLVLCRARLIGGVHELPGELGSLSSCLVELEVSIGELLPEALEFGVEVSLKAGKLLMLGLGGAGGVFLHEALELGLQQGDLVAKLFLLGPQLLPQGGASVDLQVIVSSQHGHI